MKAQTKAGLQLVLAAATFGTVGVFVKHIDLPSAETALYRACIAIVILLVALVVSGKLRTLRASRKDYGKLFLSGAAMGGNWILIFEAFRYTSVALATLSYYFASTIVVVASTLLLKEKSSLKQVFCFLGSTAGLVLCIGASSGGGSDLKGILFGLGAAFLYATVILINKVTGEIDGISRTFMQFVSAVCVLVPYIFLSGGFHLSTMNSTSLGNLMILGVVHTGLMYCIYFSAIGKLKGQQAAILSYVDPLMSVIVSIWMLGETVGMVQLVGGGMIVGFAVVNEVFPGGTN